MRRALIGIAGIAAFFALRSFVFPASAPTWLRGTSPFNWLATRAERDHCIAFANMMGSTMGVSQSGDQRDDPVDVSIDRTVRVHDSLVFEGKASRRRLARLLFHCATANVRGHPGEHKTAATAPWLGHAEDWPAAHHLEEQMERQCADSAAALFPASRISKRMLVLRPQFDRADIHGIAIDTLDDAEHEFRCAAWTYERGSVPFKQFGEFSVQLSSPSRLNPGP